MVDNLKIGIREKLRKPAKDRLMYVGHYQNYKSSIRCLYDLPNKYLNHALRITDFGDHITIANSWLKWKKGADSLDDLTYEEIAEVCEEIAEALGLKLKYVSNGKLISAEVGRTFSLRGGTCSALLAKNVRFFDFEDKALWNFDCFLWAGLYG